MLFARSAVPQTAQAGLQHTLLSKAAESRLTVFTAPAGYLCADSLASALKEHGRPTVWLRLGPEDADPAACLVSLIASAQKLLPTVGLETLERMRRHPGPVAGWSPLFANLGHELAQSLPTQSAIVLEHVHHLFDLQPTLELLSSHLLLALPASVACIVTAHRRLPFSLWPAFAHHPDTSELRINARMAADLFQRNAIGLPTQYLERAAALADSRAQVLSGLCAAAVDLGPAPIQQAIERATNLDDLLYRVTCACLVSADTGTLLALALAARLEYSHPELVQATLGNITLSAGPWLEALTNDWTRVRCVWKTPLRAALSGFATPSHAILHRMADYLASQNAVEQAVPLYYEIGDTAGAAQAIAQVADTMLDLGQWRTMGNWLDQLNQQSPKSAEWPNAPKPASLWNRLLSTLGLRRRSSRSAVLRESYAPTPEETPQNITEATGETPGEAAVGTSYMSESEVPAPQIPAATNEPALTIEALPMIPGTVLAPQEPTHAQVTGPANWAAHPTANPFLPIMPAAEQAPVLKAETLPASPDATLTPPLADLAQEAHSIGSDAAPIQAPTLTAHLLGAFRVSVNDQPIVNWPSGRGRAVLKYLLIHHNQSQQRDVLMDVFWPDADPASARNRLHVALHGLRQRFRAVTDIPIVVFHDGAYSLNPDLHVWIDVDEFDRHVEVGHRREAAGQVAKAAAEYELAISLYQDDVLADDPYEEWPVLMRERLRVAYLDTLDRLSHIYFDRGEYAACVTLCQLILARDDCREDAHCLLMGCYSRQGQRHLALRQYQTCVEALHAELQVGPAPATTHLAERIRRHEQV